MPEQTTGGKFSLWGIVGCAAFVALIILMISHDLQKELYLLMTVVLSVFFMVIAFDVGIDPSAAEPATVTAPSPVPVIESKSAEQPVVARKTNKSTRKRR
jgi:hypothetical protein